MLDLKPWLENTRQVLLSSDEAKTYLLGRGVTPTDCIDLEIGFARRFAKSFIDNHEATLWNQTFCGGVEGSFPARNMLIFPMHDLSGRPIAFTTRSVKKKYFLKYIPEEASFKGVFWGWKPAIDHIQRSGKVVIVEGIFDLISIRKFIPNSLATLTCMFSGSQLEKILRYVDHVILAWDMDEGGRRAVGIWQDRLSRYKVGVSCLEYPHHDPNDWFLSDPTGMEKRLSSCFW